MRIPFLQKYVIIKEPTIMHLEMESSSTNEIYKVDIYISCSCKGWKFRKKCRHTQQALNEYGRK